MTTNVYDVATGKLTSDSRWSFEEADWIVSIDDTGYDKIVADSSLGLLFAGGMAKIDIWKNWMLGGRIGEPPVNHVDGISIIAVDMATGNIIFTTDYLLFSSENGKIEATYGGTGAPHAKDCWQINRCAMRAIGSAIVVDKFSGGLTMYVDRASGATNLTNTESYQSVNNQLKERGIMTNTKDSQQTVLVRAAANDPSNPVAQKIANKVLSGQAMLNAPFPGMDQPWTNEKKAELAAALSRFSRRN